jgi:hypothetical protein
MVSHLGLQHVNIKINGSSPVDLEVIKRLYWSCYFWDKYDRSQPAILSTANQSITKSNQSLYRTFTFSNRDTKHKFFGPM